MCECLCTNYCSEASYNIDKYFPRFSYFVVILLKFVKFEKLAKYLSFCIMHHVIACKKYHAFSIPLELKERLESDLISLSITAKDCLDLLNLFCISSFFHVVDP